MRAAPATGKHAVRVDLVDRQRADQPSDFAFRRGLHSTPGNVPAELTSFIGRSVELRCVRELLVEARLLTLVGVGGCGKTRLAMQCATGVVERFPGGAWWVELAALQGPELVGITVIEALGLRERSGQAPVEVLREHLRDQRALLVLDNCEHVLDAAAKLGGALLRSCPELVILATSREVLGVPGELSYRVPSLNLVASSGSPEDVMHSDALRLLIDRAVLARPDFAVSKDNARALQAICSGLDGIPLAIELAAARMRVLSPQQIAAQLGDRFELLTRNARDVAARHQTLRALIDWSYELCTERERVLLRRLSVWRGGWTLDGAEAIGADEAVERRAVLDVLTGLVDKSLVDTHERAGEMRYGMLETIRQYAAERLAEAGEVDVINTRHLGWCLELAERAEPELVRHDARTWLNRLEVEDANLRTALERATAGDVDVALRLVAALTFFWLMRGRLEEGTASMERVLYKTPQPSALRARVQWGLSYLNIQLRHHQFKACYHYGLAAFIDGAAAGDDSVSARAHGAMTLVVMNDSSGLVTREDGSVAPGARVSWELAAARARKANDEWYTAEATRLVAWTYVRQGEHDLARPILEDAYALARQLGYQPMHASYFQMRAWGELEHGRIRSARELAQQATAIASEIGEPLTLGLATALLVECDVLQGRPTQARICGEPCMQLMRSAGTRNAQLQMGCALALADIAEGAPDRARKRIEATLGLLPADNEGLPSGFLERIADDLQARTRRLLADIAEGALDRPRKRIEATLRPVPAEGVWKEPVPPVRIADQQARTRRPLAVALLLLGDLDKAHDEAHELLAHAHASSNEHAEASARELLGRVALARGSIGEAEDQLRQSLEIGVRRDFRVLTLNSLECVARVAALTDSPAEAARLLAAVSATREQSGLVRWPPEPEVWAAVEQDVRMQLGDDAYAQTWADGLALSLEDAAAYAHRGRGQRKRPKHGWESLTPTELQVVRHVTGGLTNPQIGERMYISRATVKAHLSHIFAKLQTSSRSELAAQATIRGFDAPDTPKPPAR